jgi:hypothetical protein
MPEDFMPRYGGVTYEAMLDWMESGEMMIRMWPHPLQHSKKVRIMWIPQMRGVGQPAVDFFAHIGYPCSALGPNGCKYPLQTRPMDGAQIKPDKRGFGYCENPMTDSAVITAWLPYQAILWKLARKMHPLGLEIELQQQMRSATAWADSELGKLNRSRAYDDAIATKGNLLWIEGMGCDFGYPYAL